MIRPRCWLASVLAALAFTFAFTGQAAETPVERHGALRVQGNRIVDRRGEPVALRGMSLFWSQWQGGFYNAEAIRWLRDDWHCSVVRVAVGIEGGGYLKNPAAEKAKAEAVSRT